MGADEKPVPTPVASTNLSPGAGSNPAAGKVWLGTCAWNFDDWRNVFYPDGLASGQQLAYYANYLPAVEVDSTFYHIPRADVAAGWAARTPDDFVFTAKMPKLITHEARLRFCERELTAFLGSLRPMGEKLGAVLIQFSPAFRPASDEDALREFLDLLPVGKPGMPDFAVEFRHADWRRRRFVKLLEEHGVAWTWNDLSAVADEAAAPYEVLPQTADFLYVRLMGDLETKFRPDGERHFRYGSMLWSRDAGLEGWARRIEKHLGDARRIYVLANNHYEGFSPLTCQRLGKLLGIPIALPSLAAHAARPGEAPRELDEQMDLL